MKRMFARFLSFIAMFSFISCGETYDLEWEKIEGGYYQGHHVHRFWILSYAINWSDDEYAVYGEEISPLDGEGFCSWIDSALPSTRQLAYAASMAEPLSINIDTEMIAEGPNDSSRYRFRCAFECRKDGDCGGNRRCQDYQCVLQCAEGQNDGGDGICRPNGECSKGFHNGGDGDCLKNGYCSDGYHDGGDGICLRGHDAFSGCSTGYHNGGNGTCVRNGICSVGYHNGGDGVCVDAGKCSSGYHDGGDGECLKSGHCSDGYHNGGDGICLKGADARSGCSIGYHNGGDDVCVTNGSCSSRYHDGGDGICLKGHDAFSGCSSGYHNGGDGVCVRNGICSSGYHDGGNGTCMATGKCASGYTLGSNGVCTPKAVIVSVRIPAGSFKSSASNTTVSLSAFKLAKTPTTVAQFKQCVDAGKCSSSNYIAYSSSSPFCNYNRGGPWNNDPMNCVNWYGAKSFCEWVGGRLPTEDEWEYAATHNGSKALQTTYPWGNAAPTHCGHANYWDKDSDTTCNERVAVSDENMVGTSSVGIYSPEGNSPLGLQDMAGNVFEWTSTWASGETLSGYILQGSSWRYNEPTLRIGHGFYLMDPTGWNDETGFRCAFSQ